MLRPLAESRAEVESNSEVRLSWLGATQDYGGRQPLHYLVGPLAIPVASGSRRDEGS